MIAERLISEDEYRDWSERLRQAEQTQGPSKKKKIEKVHAMIEQDLNIIGSTAVQDNLQEEVPETLAKFREAGISVWVLTGDKEETAVNIGFAAGMLTTETQRLFVTSPNSSKLLT